MIFKFLVISWLAWCANSIILGEDGLGNLQDFDESITTFENDDEASRRRHRRPRPCTPHRSFEEEKTFVNLYYSDIDYSIIPNSQGSGSGCPPTLGLGSDTYLNTPQEINGGPAKPGLLQTLFGGFLENRPQFQGIQSFQQQSAPQAFGPLGGFAAPPSQSKVDRINYKRTFKQLSREVNRFFRPFYRLF